MLKENIYSGAKGSKGEKPSKVKQGVGPDDCQGSKFLLWLIVGQLTFWRQVGRGEGANNCQPHIVHPRLKLSSTLPPVILGHHSPQLTRAGGGGMCEMNADCGLIGSHCLFHATGASF